MARSDAIKDLSKDYEVLCHALEDMDITLDVVSDNGQFTEAEEAELIRIHKSFETEVLKLYRLITKLKGK